MRFLNEEELKQFGKVGKNVLVDSTTLWHKPENVTIGDNVRIDAFCFFSATNGIEFGSFIHVAPYVQMVSAGGKITCHDYTAFAARTTILTASDDFTEGWMNNPTMPIDLRKVKAGPITFHKFSVTGCGAVILPGVTLGEGAAVGALTIVKKDIEPFACVVGTPLRKIATRSEENLHLMEKKLHEMLSVLP